jgi:hypothetical protein
MDVFIHVVAVAAVFDGIASSVRVGEGGASLLGDSRIAEAVLIIVFVVRARDTLIDGAVTVVVSAIADLVAGFRRRAIPPLSFAAGLHALSTRIGAVAGQALVNEAIAVVVSVVADDLFRGAARAFTADTDLIARALDSASAAVLRVARRVHTVTTAWLETRASTGTGAITAHLIVSTGITAASAMFVVRRSVYTASIAR